MTSDPRGALTTWSGDRGPLLLVDRTSELNGPSGRGGLFAGLGPAARESDDPGAVACRAPRTESRSCPGHASPTRAQVLGRRACPYKVVGEGPPVVVLPGADAREPTTQQLSKHVSRSAPYRPLARSRSIYVVNRRPGMKIRRDDAAGQASAAEYAADEEFGRVEPPVDVMHLQRSRSTSRLEHPDTVRHLVRSCGGPSPPRSRPAPAGGAR